MTTYYCKCEQDVVVETMIHLPTHLVNLNPAELAHMGYKQYVPAEIPAHDPLTHKLSEHVFVMEPLLVTGKWHVQELSDQEKQAQLNKQALNFLQHTDWQVLRHIRQQNLGIPTSLSSQAYMELELKRQQAAESIKQ